MIKLLYISFFIILFFQNTALKAEIKDSSNKLHFFQEFNLSYDIGYFNINTSKLNGFFAGNNFGGQSPDFVGTGLSFSVGNGKNRFGLSYQAAIPIIQGQDVGTSKYIRLDNSFFEGFLSHDLLKSKKFMLPIGIGYAQGFETISLITTANLPSNINQVATDPPSATVLTEESRYLTAFIRPGICLYNNPQRSFSKLILSLNFKYYYSFNQSDWVNQNYTSFKSPDFKMNAIYIGLAVEGYFNR